MSESHIQEKVSFKIANLHTFQSCNYNWDEQEGSTMRHSISALSQSFVDFFGPQNLFEEAYCCINRNQFDGVINQILFEGIGFIWRNSPFETSLNSGYTSILI